MLSVVLIALVLSAMFYYLDNLSKNKIRDFSIANAQMYIETLATVRSLYTSEVVSRALKNGMTVTHDYLEHENAIPLPATFSMDLGNSLSIKGVKSRLYSAYPFPWRKSSGGLSDSFSRDAWQALNKEPSRDYYKFEMVNGVQSLRFARADIMLPSCVNCHNTHLDSPYLDWHVGDVRGVLEIVIPIEATIDSISGTIRDTFLLQFAVFIIIAGAIYVFTGRLKLQVSQGEQANELLLDIAMTDELTGIANRRLFIEKLAKEWLHASQEKESLAVVLIDVDNFKLYNDNYGHPAGDVVLRAIGQALKSAMFRPCDHVCRYGGEEFVVLLPDTDSAGAKILADRMRRKIEKLMIKHQFSSASEVVTISAGVYAMVPAAGFDQKILVEQADKALYAAKEKGRNNVQIGRLAIAQNYGSS